MCALYRTTTHVQGRADDFIDPKSLCPHGRTYDVDDGIHSANFVKVHFLDGRGVNFCLRRSQTREISNRAPTFNTATVSSSSRGGTPASMSAPRNMSPLTPEKHSR